MYKSQYVLFLEKVYEKQGGGHLSPSSVKHYANESIRKIDEFVKDMNIENVNSIYDIDSCNELERIKSILFSNSDFIKLDSDGNQMYSAGFNRYVDFAEGKSLFKKESKLTLLDQPLPVKRPRMTAEKSISDRDSLIIRQVEMAAGYYCQINPTHLTFIASNTQKNYVEGHHLIPMKWQYEFKNSLDVYANILVLCPNCHRLLHYGDIDKSDRKKIIGKVFEERKERLFNSGIKLSRNDFLDLVLS